MDHNRNSQSNTENSGGESIPERIRACLSNRKRNLILIIVSLMIIVTVTLLTVFVFIKKETITTTTTTATAEITITTTTTTAEITITTTTTTAEITTTTTTAEITTTTTTTTTTAEITTTTTMATAEITTTTTMATAEITTTTTTAEITTTTTTTAAEITTTTTTAEITTTTTTTAAEITTTIEVCETGATAIIFDDIQNKSSHQGNIPSVYNRLSWTNGYYMNTTVFLGTGYDFAHGSGEYVAWFNSALTIETLIDNNTITLNSCVTAAAWSDSLFLTIDGYYNNKLLNTTTVPLNTYTQTVLIFNWYELNKIVFTPSGSGYYDIGIDNLCVTF